MKRLLYVSLILVAAGALLSACRPPGNGAASPSGGGAPMFSVVAIEARRQPVVESVSLVGTLAANEEVEVQAETDGIVKEILFQEGEPVEEGEPLLRLDDTKLGAELAEAQARLDLYRAEHARAEQLLRENLISQQEFEQASSAYESAQATVELKQRQLQDAQVMAPFAGRTGARRISPGQYITRNTVVTWLVDLDPMKVEMNVPERFLSQTEVGQPVDFGVTAYPDRRFTGEIYFVDSRLDLGTRTALVKTRISNPDGVLRAGMVANLELTLQLREDAVVIPEAALMSNGDNAFVYVVGEEQTVMIRPVETGIRLPRFTEIRSGLEGGEQVIVEGHQKVGPGMKVALAPPEKGSVYRSSSGPKAEEAAAL
jgi:membrane fusion protein (multidrug efflux system)